MNHPDHVQLIQNSIPNTGGIWADLGSGRGAFTLALAEIIGEEGVIYSVDRDKSALQQQIKQMGQHFPQVTLHSLVADFTNPLDLPPLDGIIMANSLHFIADKLPVLRRINTYLKSGGRLIVVEYNTNTGNRWVPHPITYKMWEQLAQQAGFVSTMLLRTRPSSFLGEFFSALSLAPLDSEIPSNP